MDLSTQQQSLQPGQYGFFCTTSSPQFPGANGAAKIAVRTLKDPLNKSDDPYLAIQQTGPLY